MSKRKKINKDELLGMSPIMKELFLKEMDASIWVKVMTGEERRNFHIRCATDKKKTSDGTPECLVPLLIIMCSCWDTGEPIFTFEDMEAIDKLPSTVMGKIFETAAELNGLTQKSIDKKVKN